MIQRVVSKEEKRRDSTLNRMKELIVIENGNSTRRKRFSVSLSHEQHVVCGMSSGMGSGGSVDSGNRCSTFHDIAYVESAVVHPLSRYAA